MKDRIKGKILVYRSLMGWTFVARIDHVVYSRKDGKFMYVKVNEVYFNDGAWGLDTIPKVKWEISGQKTFDDLTLAVLEI